MCQWRLIRVLWLVTVLTTGDVTAGQITAEEKENQPCAECHAGIAESFAGTRMAIAASERFRRQWQDRESPDYCMNCHAPSGGEGLVCADCHGPGPHPYAKLDVPEVCARCHDAPGENTVRQFRQSPAARKGMNCLDCHLPDKKSGVDHRFEGPSVSGFLDNVAKLRLNMRLDESRGPTAVIQVSHRAGHALPGGTTGRAVWSVVKGLKADSAVAWTMSKRFGWEHHPVQGWLDRTLKPGRAAVLELDGLARGDTVRIRAELKYRFRAGPLDREDPREVGLDAVELGLP